MHVLDLFSGIGGFSLGLERAGMETIAFCEIDPFCRKVLAKHWPSIPIHEDITKLRGEHVGPVDLVCGGFPCQDISFAGQGAGIDGERSGLWKEYARLVGELRPRYVFVENVAALLGRGLGRVLGDLAAFGYDAEWHCIPASAVGAPHRRDRVWIVAHADSIRSGKGQTFLKADTKRHFPDDIRSLCSHLANANGKRLSNHKRRTETEKQHGNGTIGCRGWLAGKDDYWRIEPDVGRVAHGVPMRVDRIRALGNAVVPQIVEQIGRAIMQAELD